MAKYKKYTTWVWSDKLNDWRAVASKRPWQKEYRRSYTAKRAAQLQNREKKKGRLVTARPSHRGKPTRAPKGKQFKSVEDLKWEVVRKHLYGDLDAKLDLMYQLALVAKDLGKKIYVAEGTRSVKDQWKYWLAYKAGKGPLAAFPGTSNHTNGDAIDAREGKARGTRNLGDIPGARRSMKKHGLCLPVPGETWQTELGNTWRA